MTPHVPSSRPADAATSQPTLAAEQPSFARGKWRLLLCLLVLGLTHAGGCTLSPGQDIPSITTTGDGDGFTTDDPTTGSPIAGSGGASSSGSGGAPHVGIGGMGGIGGERCSDAPGGEGGMTPIIAHIECGGAPE